MAKFPTIPVLEEYRTLRFKQSDLIYRVLTRVFDLWEIPEDDRPKLMFVSPATYARWGKGKLMSRTALAVAKKYIRFNSALVHTCGRDVTAIMHWLNTSNRGLPYSGRTPLQSIIADGERTLTDGLVNLEYLAHGR